MVVHDAYGTDIFSIRAPYWFHSSLIIRNRTFWASFKEWDHTGKITYSKAGPTDRGYEWLRNMVDPE